MELHVVSTEGIPDGCVLSVRAGATRRQAPVAADRPFRFPTPASEAMPFKVDVLEPVASARLILRPGEELRTDCQYTIPLESAQNPSDGPPHQNDGKSAPEMSVTIAVAPADDKGDDEKADGGEKRTATGTASSASRHGQANAAREYLDKHNLVEFTQLLVQSVIKEQPDRPYAFMAKQFYFPDPKPRTGAKAAAAKPAEAAAPKPEAAPPADATVNSK
mmetsp:Transcript_83140/g.238872  ORF Transcript_83140/g.238872 Transcript_83140/m.238872 type:complete len:219 (+) Transcript_83140:72-728(+)|eukprot:CAMPEP_0177353716 /NCGR_PEP_ID=MMETSP0368-20130122/33036_1 /TAXON_ID=447022 ORGANISM="Scrippsiella hangoei-like, Strain SHHI-4" /NCGR_SAMPLE_ID=MMETSP0368 /ASSEMBLY_ACC=CAM_ASM_000363 /LENGTH=218 /DNA_ID=CAMNT_0018815791 /DNA_START=28 /DNA_END=684 /DNA_ORIENTATION=+